MTIRPTAGPEPPHRRQRGPILGRYALAKLSYHPGVCARLILPSQLISDPRRTSRTECLAPLGVSQETFNSTAVGLEVARVGEHRRTVGNLSCFRQVERNERNAERMYSIAFTGDASN